MGWGGGSASASAAVLPGGLGACPSVLGRIWREIRSVGGWVTLPGPPVNMCVCSTCSARFPKHSHQVVFGWGGGPMVGLESWVGSCDVRVLAQGVWRSALRGDVMLSHQRFGFWVLPDSGRASPSRPFPISETWVCRPLGPVAASAVRVFLGLAGWLGKLSIHPYVSSAFS